MGSHDGGSWLILSSVGRTRCCQQIVNGPRSSPGQYGHDERRDEVSEHTRSYMKQARSLIFPREKMYSKGGIFSITSRILVVDLLSSMIDDFSGRTFS